jgi:predicted acetyltransferase
MRAADVKGAWAVTVKECRMEIYKLKPEEHKDTRRLYGEVFSEDSQSFVDYYYTEKTKDNQIYAAVEEGDIQAMLHLNPYVLMVNGQEKPADYIVAVATREKYRRRGLMAKLMHTALKDMYREGKIFTFLMPAAESIYLPHDFRTVYEQERKLSDSEERVFFEAGEQGMDAFMAGEKDVPLLARTAEKHLSEKYQVYARRSEEYYRRLLKEISSDGGKLYLFSEKGTIRDYRIFDADYMEEKRPKIMVRIVDVRRMLLSVKLRTLMAACLTVTDPVIKENNQCLTITGTEHSGVMLMEGKTENSEGTVTIAALAGFLFGACSVEEICKEEGVRLSGRLKEEMKKIIPLRRIFLNEAV